MAFAIANYTLHQADLKGLAGPKCDRRFLFLEGPGDYGKTWLLKWLQADPRPPGLLYFDLGASHEFLSPSVILATSVGRIGRARFPSYSHYADLLLTRPVTATVNDNTITGSNITVTASARGETPAEKLYNAIQLTDRFVEDLVALPPDTPPVIFVFDGGDHAQPDQGLLLINQWLDQSLLPGLLRATCARLIIAGRTVPDWSGKPWSATSAGIKLQGVRDANEWIGLVKALRKGYPPKASGNPAQYFEIVIDALQGVPGQIMAVVKNFPEETVGG